VKLGLHEVVHAISYEYDINLTEKQVRKFEKSLKDIVSNGNLFKQEGTNETIKTKRRNIGN
jgi:hypothetical protein